MRLKEACCFQRGGHFYLAGIPILILLCLLLDPPFVVHAVLLLGILALAAKAAYRDRETKLLAFIICPLSVTVLLLYYILSDFELERRGFNYSMDGVDLTRQFFRIAADNLAYAQSIRTIDAFLNNGSIAEAVPAFGLNVWASDPLRFDFLLRYLDSAAMTAPFVCLLESDVVVRNAYFRASIAKASPDIVHVQHFHGRNSFEPANLGALCAAKDASPLSRLWLTIGRWLHSRRYRRLIPQHLFFALAPNRLTLGWEADGGCTMLREHCNYVHFTRPKELSMQAALEFVRRNS